MHIPNWSHTYCSCSPPAEGSLIRFNQSRSQVWAKVRNLHHNSDCSACHVLQLIDWLKLRQREGRRRAFRRRTKLLAFLYSWNRRWKETLKDIKCFVLPGAFRLGMFDFCKLLWNIEFKSLLEVFPTWIFFYKESCLLSKLYYRKNREKQRFFFLFFF